VEGDPVYYGGLPLNFNLPYATGTQEDEAFPHNFTDGRTYYCIVDIWRDMIVLGYTTVSFQ
jgi:hypothetical protein